MDYFRQFSNFGNNAGSLGLAIVRINCTPPFKWCPFLERRCGYPDLYVLLEIFFISYHPKKFTNYLKLYGNFLRYTTTYYFIYFFCMVYCFRIWQAKFYFVFLCFKQENTPTVSTRMVSELADGCHRDVVKSIFLGNIAELGHLYARFFPLHERS
jgi:hypothetical protein